ncbi:GNAT family N-acetyltransferase [Ulvibacterium sp.]|uniref:GNAT family N-acetyltransferase n=1 Tax=Ulvibacterium sp. TaxID=2665914 RepID=UPI002604B541|nr:GNAT family N-acetyltransferase [Ulvibacterium sp.]
MGPSQRHLILRKCDQTNLDELVELSLRTFKDAFEADNDPDDFKDYLRIAFHRDTLFAELQDKDVSFYFVKVDNRTAGYFKLNENLAQTEVKSNSSIELERIYVLNIFQGSGIGAWMLTEIKRIASEKGKHFLWLGVWEKNHKAIRFYQRLGFTKFGTHPYFIGKDKQTDWLMRLDLINLDSEYIPLK